MAFLANLRSTIAYQTTGSTISTGAIYTTLAGNVPTWSNQLTYSTLTGSTISTNSIATASTLTGSSIILSGNMGIGKTAPATILDITGTLSVNNGVGAPSSPGNFQGLQLSYVGTGASGYGQIIGINPGSTYTSLCLNPFSQGNVGIGTNNPSQILEVYRNSGVGTIAQMNITSWAGAGTITNQSILNLRIQGAGGGSVDNTIIGQYYGSGTGTYGISFNPNNGANVMNVLGNGRVGIGTSDPATTLHVSGASSTYTNGQLFISDANYPGNQLRLFSYWGIQISTSFTTIQSMYDTTPNRLAINPNGGNVGIGTVYPQAILHVHESPVVGDVSRKEAIRGTRNGTGGVQNNVSMALSYGPNTIAVSPYGVIDFKVNGLPDADNGYGYIPNVTVMSVVGNGRVGIGITNPSCSLHIGTRTPGIPTPGGTGRIYSPVDIATWAAGGIPTGISILTYGDIVTELSFIAVSDIRIKKNIQPVTECIQKLEQMDIVSYDKIDYNEPSVDVGIIAQNVINILPNAVRTLTDIIPNIYAKATHEPVDSMIRIYVTCDQKDIKNGQKVKMFIMRNNKEEEYTDIIHNHTGTQFDIKPWKDYSADQHIFVYGTEVNDFLSVDKDQIGILAAGGVKEIYKIVQQQASYIESLESRLASLEQRLITAGIV